jgi:hypothetical protein
MRVHREASAGASGPGDGGCTYVPLGIVASSSPSAVLISSLKEIRPQFDVRLKRISDERGIETLYRVEVALGEASTEAHSIDTWLRIKSALVTAFPAGKPGAVTAIDP